MEKREVRWFVCFVRVRVCVCVCGQRFIGGLSSIEKSRVQARGNAITSPKCQSYSSRGPRPGYAEFPPTAHAAIKICGQSTFRRQQANH